MPATALRQKLITDQVVDRAGTLANLQVFRGEIDKPLETLANSDRVNRYVVVHPLGRTDGPDPRLDDSTGDLTYAVQLNCGAGFETDCEFLFDEVFALFNRWIPTVPGLVFGAFRPPPGYQSGDVRRNDAVKPPRFWLPAQFQIVATAT